MIFKMLFVFLNIFQINNNYNLIIREEVNFQEIIYEDEMYISYLEGEEIYLKPKNDEWIRNIGYNKNIIIYNLENKIYIFSYMNNVLSTFIYDALGNKVKESVLLSNQLDDYGIEYNEYFYIYGGISKFEDEIFLNQVISKGQKDSFIIKVDMNLEIINLNTYGGLLNESFIKMVVNDDTIVVAGKKDVTTGGDFGNGGKHDNTSFIALINSDLILQNYIVIDDTSKISNLFVFANMIYYISNNYVIKFDYELNLIKSNLVNNDLVLSLISNFNKLILFTESNVLIYDIINLSLEIDYFSKFNFSEIRLYPNILYCNGKSNYYLDIAYLGNIKYLEIIYNQYTPELIVETIFGEAKYISENSNPVFDPNIFGIHKRVFAFANQAGIVFEVEKETVVNLEVNITNGVIYRLGYMLRFTGEGYLNGRKIYNNYSINEEGEYKLELVGLNETRLFTFFIEKDQLLINEDKVIYYHQDVNLKEVYYITLKYTNELNLDIHSVIINDVTYNNIILDKLAKTINIKMGKEEIPGIKHLEIVGINYLDGEDIIYKPINEIYVLNVLRKDPLITINVLDKYNYIINVEEDGVLRYIQISYLENGIEKVYNYSLTNNKIIIPNLNSDFTYQLSVNLCYDLGNKSIKALEIFNFEITNSNKLMLDLELQKSEINSKSFLLNIDKNIQKVYVGDDLVYNNEETNYLQRFIYGILLSVIIGLLVYFIKNKTRKKTLKYSK